MVMGFGLDQLTSDQRDEYEERAAIMEFLGGMTRERAGAEALKRIVERDNK